MASLAVDATRFLLAADLLPAVLRTTCCMPPAVLAAGAAAHAATMRASCLLYAADALSLLFVCRRFMPAMSIHGHVFAARLQAFEARSAACRARFRRLIMMFAAFTAATSPPRATP